MKRKPLDMVALGAAWPMLEPPLDFADRVLAACEPSQSAAPRAVASWSGGASGGARNAAQPARAGRIVAWPARSARRAGLVLGAAALAMSVAFCVSAFRPARDASPVGVASIEADLGSQPD